MSPSESIGCTCMKCGRPHQRTFARPFCPTCADVSAQAIKAAQAEGYEPRPRESKRERRWARICPPEYQATEIEKLPSAAKQWAPRVGNLITGANGLTIHGPTGAGKTRLAYLALRAGLESGRALRVIQATEIRIRLFTGWAEGSKLLDEASSPDLLLIDDLGQGSKSEQADSLILSILERRIAWRRPTITTTQYSSAAILERFFSREIGEAIVRRIGKSFATSIDLRQKEG